MPFSGFLAGAMPTGYFIKEGFSMSILKVEGLTQTFGDKKLFHNASMQLSRGEKLGLTGLNGAGKSTFLGMLTGTVIPDEGLIRWNPKIRLGYLDQQAKLAPEQTVRDYLRTAFQALFDAEGELAALDAKLAACRDDEKLHKLLARAGDLQEFLESNNFYSVMSEIEKVAAGLGIVAFGLDRPVGELSGGQRAKVMLAKLLLEQPDVLLLDEPTNFLDREHIDWLAKYLAGFRGSFIVVSHDKSFLNRVVNCVCDIEFGVMSRYNGSFESFERQKEQKRMEYVRSYQAQQKEIGKLEDYIGRNLARASTSAMAKSRRKKLEKIERLDKPNEAPKPTFLFQHRQARGKTALWVNDLSVGYSEPLLPEINLILATGQKLAVTGFNGIGKSTFLKTVCGLLTPLAGNVKLAEETTIGYFEQEHRWEDPAATPLQVLHDAYPRMTDKELRGHLSRCGLTAVQVMQGVGTLSGGEQAKVRLCVLTLRPCSLLVLDEPTNHLDRNAVEQLQTAVKTFEGSVLFVSHSKAFCEQTADAVLDLEALFD